MIWRMAWRNLWRNRRRTSLTIAAVGLGLAVLILMVSFIEGMVEMMVDQVARSSFGHVQIHHPDYLEKKATGLVLRDASSVAAILEKHPGVEAFSQRLILSGSIRSSTSSSVKIVKVIAVDPEMEGKFSALSEKLVEGGFVVPPQEALQPDAPLRYRERKGILMGRRLAQQLRVEIGSKVRVDCAGFHGGTTAAAFYVTGIIDTGSESFDSQMVMVELQGLQALTGAGNSVHEIAVMADSHKNLDQLATEIQQKVDALGHERLGEVLPWYKVAPDISQMIDMTRSMTSFLYGLMMIIMSAGILTTMFMVVLERKREFGVQLALGVRSRQLFAGLLAESLFIALLACVAGLVVGAAGVAWLVEYGIDLSWLLGGFEFRGLYVESVYRGSNSPGVFYEPAIVVFLGTLFFAFWPALRVARMGALDGLASGSGT